MTGKLTAVVILLLSLLPIAHATGGDLEDAYDAGFKEGRKKGYDEGRQAAVSGWGHAGSTPQVLGKEFNTTIAPKAGTNFQVAPDSSIAIIPNGSLDEFQQKLGADLLRDKKILLNDGPAAP